MADPIDPPVRRGPKRPAKAGWLSFRASAETIAAVDARAVKEQRSRSDMLRLLLRDGMEARR